MEMGGIKTRKKEAASYGLTTSGHTLRAPLQRPRARARVHRRRPNEQQALSGHKTRPGSSTRASRRGTGIPRFYTDRGPRSRRSAIHTEKKCYSTNETADQEKGTRVTSEAEELLNEARASSSLPLQRGLVLAFAPRCAHSRARHLEQEARWQSRHVYAPARASATGGGV